MKKLTALLLSICLLVGSSMNVFATQTTDPNATEMSVPIEYTQQSTYTLYIPEVIDLTYGEYVFEANYIDILESEVVVITAPGYVTMTSDEGKTGSMQFNGSDSRGVAVFENGNTTSVSSMYAQFDGTAGHYTGTATFTIAIQQK